MESSVWLFLNFVTIAFLAFYSMAEMALISANPIRIEFLATQGSNAARKVLTLLKKPSRLFATTLIGVNVFMMTGSEFSRQYYLALGLDPDFSAVTQIVIVILLGELVPQFVARRFPEKVALFAAPMVYASSKLLAPFVAFLQGLTHLMNWILGTKERSHQFIMTEEEIEKILSDEERTEKKSDAETMASRLFKWKKQKASSVLHPFAQYPHFPATISIGDLRTHLTLLPKWVLLYGKDKEQILGIVYLRDLLRAPDNKKARDYLLKPTFVTENTALTALLTTFRRNSETIAFVVNPQGKPIGLVTLDHSLEFLYPKPQLKNPLKQMVDVTVDGNMTLKEFEERFGLLLSSTGAKTISEYLHQHFTEPPQVGDTMDAGPFELKVLECSMIDITKVQVKTNEL